MSPPDLPPGPPPPQEHQGPWHRLSRSPIWDQQRAHYQALGSEAWSAGGTPHQVSTNPRLAASYAAVLTGWLRDLASSGPRHRPDLGEAADLICIVELGAGSGRFAFHLLRALAHSLALPALGDLPVRYVMTDISETNLLCWREHPRLRPFVEAGLLDFATFDVQAPAPLRLRESGVEVGETRWPVAVLGNYVFDSTPQDAFAVDEGVLHEVLVAAPPAAPSGEGARSQPEVIALETHRRPLDPSQYEDPGLIEVLHEYTARVEAASFTVSNTALRCLHHFSAMSGGELLMLLGDKGPVELRQLLGDRRPTLVRHGGSASSLFNFHALGRALAHRGGQLLHTRRRRRHFEIVAGLLSGHGDATMPETRSAYTRAVELDNPVDTFELRQWACAEADEHPLTHAIALLGHSLGDTEVFEAVAERISEDLEDAPAHLLAQLSTVLQQVLEAHYPTPDGDDLAFELGLVFAAISDHSAARRAFETSLHLEGPDPATLLNAGLCCLELDELEAARRFAERALAMEPDSHEARELLDDCSSSPPPQTPRRG